MNLTAAAELVIALRPLAVQRIMGSDRIAGEVDVATDMLWTIDQIRTEADVHAQIAQITKFRDQAADTVNRLEILGLPDYNSRARGELNIYNLMLNGLAKIVES